MNRQEFRLVQVAVLKPYRLRLTYQTGETVEVEVGEIIRRIPALSGLKEWSLFQKAAVGEHGMSVTWGEDTFELAADNLYARAVEQGGGVSHEMLWDWMHRNGHTLDSAAAALGLSRRLIAYYRSGVKPIPKHVWLACIGWETLARQAA